MTPAGRAAWWRPGLNGAVASAVTLVVAWLLPSGLRSDLLAGLLLVTVGIYLGFAIREDRTGSIAVEGLGALLFGGLALAGQSVAPWLLAVGWLAHPLWDLAHHPGAIRTPVTAWVIPFCLVYDLVVGAAVLVWWGVPGF